MKNIFKRLEVLAINSKAANFKGAVIRLTSYYTLGVFLILCVFSFLVYGLFSADIEERLHKEREYSEEVDEAEDWDPLAEEVTENLFDILLLSDAVLLFLTVIVSYALAKKTLAPLALSYQKQQRFVADAAHELRTPLAVMKAGSEVLLQNERSIEQYKKFTQESQEEVDRLIALSNDLLFLVQNKVMSKELFETVSLSDVCVAQCEHMRSYAALKGVEVHAHIEEEILLKGRKDDLSRLVLNLLKNAIDYNKPQGSVTITVKKERQLALLTLADTGIGIAQKDMPYIFERFYKADSSRMQKDTSGSGLGLSIVQEIVAVHGGTIRAHSSLGEGTTFELSFPLA